MSSEAQPPAAESDSLPTGHAIPRTESEDPDPLSKDVLFELLKNRRRRDVLQYLRTHDESVTLSDLAEHVAALENDISEAQLSSRQRKRVYVALYQCHLPILARANVIAFNQARGIIERTDRAEQLYPYLDEEHPVATRWSMHYMGIVIAGTLAYGITSLAPGLTVLTPLIVGLFIGAVAILALYQLNDETEGRISDFLSSSPDSEQLVDQSTSATD